MNEKYLCGVRERALWLLDGAKPGHPYLMSAVGHVAGFLGVSAERFRVWHRRREVDTGGRPGIPCDVEAENARGCREVVELKKASEVFKAARIFFVKELDLPSTK